VAAGAGIALSGVPMVCQRESHKTRLVVELFVAFRAQAEFNNKGHEGA
jgi:hypothetical protein